MEFYRTKTNQLRGTNFHEVNKRAFLLYEIIKKKSKRRPYIRSAYFKKDKIFLNLFWSHLHEKKNMRDKTRRVKFFPCAIELIKYSKMNPESKEHRTDPSSLVHRFKGITPDKEVFCVQLKEDKRNKQKWLMSVFPYGK